MVVLGGENREDRTEKKKKKKKKTEQKVRDCSKWLELEFQVPNGPNGRDPVNSMNLLHLVCTVCIRNTNRIYPKYVGMYIAHMHRFVGM